MDFRCLIIVSRTLIPSSLIDAELSLTNISKAYKKDMSFILTRGFKALMKSPQMPNGVLCNFLPSK